MSEYRILNVDTNEVLAANLTPEQVDAWWRDNADEFFGLSVVGDAIVVARVDWED